MKNIRYILIILGLISAGIVIGQNSEFQPGDTLHLTLEECRARALETNELLKIADETISQAEYQKKAAVSAYLPNVKASAIGMYSEQSYDETLYLPTQVYDSSTGELVPNVLVDPTTGTPVIGTDGYPVFNSYAYLPLDISSRGGFTAGLSLEQALYAGGKIAAGNTMAEIGISMANNNKVLKESESIYECDQMFYLYVSTIEKVKMAHQYKTLLDSLYQMVEDNYELGMINRNEVLKVKVQLNDVILQVQKAESGLQLARMSLCRVIGLPYNTPITVNDSVDNYMLDMSAINDLDVTSRVEYQLLSRQVEMAEENVKMVQGDYKPTAGVSLGYNYYNIDMQNADNIDNSGVSLMARLEIPITTFGERKGKVNAEKTTVSIRQLELKRNSELMQLEMEQARLNLVDAHLRVELAQEALEQASENVRISQDGYELGMETIVDLLGAQASWQEAYSNKIDAETGFKLATSQFLKVTNSLQF